MNKFFQPAFYPTVQNFPSNFYSPFRDALGSQKESWKSQKIVSN